MTTVYDVVQQICLGLPETEEVVSHGFPNFKVAGKVFATYSVNHHGDGKVALLLNTSRDMQQVLVESAPRHFYIPPYSGPKGWTGIELNYNNRKDGIAWQRVSDITCDAYRRTAPAALADSVTPVSVSAPTVVMKPEDIDPFLSASNQALLKRIRDICLPLPEVEEATQFGSPSFKAGKKTFCTLHHHTGKPELQTWAGPDQQSTLTSFDRRYRIPEYSGHNGWIAFDLSGKPAWKEVEARILDSYRHFALKRMLKALDGPA